MAELAGGKFVLRASDGDCTGYLDVFGILENAIQNSEEGRLLFSSHVCIPSNSTSMEMSSLSSKELASQAPKDDVPDPTILKVPVGKNGSSAYRLVNELQGLGGRLKKIIGRSTPRQSSL